MAALARFWRRYLRRYRLSYASGVVFLLLTNWLTVSIPGFVQEAIDALEAGRGEGGAVPWALAILAAGLGVIVVRTLSRTLFFNPGRTVEYRVKRDLFDRLLELPRTFFERMRPGEIVSRGTNDTNSVRALAGFATLQFGNVVLVLAFTLGKMLLLDPWLTLATALPIFASALVLRYAVRRMWTLVLESQKEIGVLSDRILESYGGAAVLHAFGAKPGALARFDESNGRMLDLGLRLAGVRSWLLPIVSVVGSLSVVLLLAVGGERVVRGDLTVGALAAFTVYIQILVSGLTSLGWMVNVIQRGLVSLRRVDDVIDAAPERPAPRAEMPAPGPEGYGLTVRDLSFTHPGVSTPALQPALRDLTFEVRPGEVVGVFGFTGSGKSTLLDLLARVREPPPGTVLLDGVPVENLPVRDYWRRVAYVTQEAFLMSASVRENVALSAEGEIDEVRLRRAVRDAALEPDLAALPDGLDTVVGERGITLSGGQRQRVALARAFYRDFDLLLLDDVLSAVDHATERALIDAIYRKVGGAGGPRRTAVVVSHRTSVLARADRVLVLDEGRLVAEGTHADLAAGEGPYAKAVRLQRAAEALEDGRAIA